MIEIRGYRRAGLAALYLARLRRYAACTLLAAERDRWFLWHVVSFGCGIAIYFALPSEPGLLSALFPLVAAFALVFVWRDGALGHFLPAAVLAFAAGIACAKFETLMAEAPVLKRKMFRAVVSGYVERLEPRPARGPRITIRVAAIQGLKPEETPYRVRIRLLSAAQNLQPGAAIEIAAMLAPPMRPALPGGYDFARSAFFEQIGAVGYARSRLKRVALPPAPWGLSVKLAVQRVRHALSERIMAAVPGERGAIANALMTGERGLISTETLAAYRNAGLLHILSISGLHMAIMAGTVFFAVRLLLAAWPSVALRYPIKKWAALASVNAALAYLLISGATHATQRAFVMVLIAMCAVALDRPAIALRNVAIAAAALLIIAPSSLLNVGFQMSFAAVIALVAAYEYARDRRGSKPPGVPRGAGVQMILFFAGIIGSTVVASLAVAPIAAYHFHKGQIYGVLANLIAVPVCNFLVMPAALLSFIAMPLGLEAWPLAAMAEGIDVMTWCARTVAGLPGAVVHIPTFSIFSFSLIILGMLWFCLWRTNWRFWGGFLVALGLCLAPLRSAPDVLVAEGGRLVAVRQADGRFAVAPGRHRRAYELSRWLENDGDIRKGHAVKAGGAFRCDPAGYTIKFKNFYIAISVSPASLADDCRRAYLLILSYPKPQSCKPGGMTLDFWQLRDGGTHAIRIDNAGVLHVARVEDMRGNRPWARKPRFGS